MARSNLLLETQLKTLRLPTFLREYDKLARESASEGLDYPRYLLRLSELELLDRERRTTERRKLNKKLVLELVRCEFIDRRENVLTLGNSERLGEGGVKVSAFWGPQVLSA